MTTSGFHRVGPGVRQCTGLCAAFAIAVPIAAGSVTTGIDAEAQLPYWEFNDGGVSIRLVQRLPDQTRAFFMARGFSADHAERIAQSCVFQTIFRNTSHESEPSPVEYDLRDWTVYHGGQGGAMKTREDWAGEWQRLAVGQGARIAFEWSLFPTRQSYQPGDYNWGMSIFDLKPGRHFDLELVWRQYGAVRTAVIKRIQCAPDAQPEAAVR